MVNMDAKKRTVDIRNTPITPVQQAISSCSGALVTSFFVTPLDVVKIRLQAQAKPFKTGSCFVYHNGLMDCLCVCSYCNGNGNGNGKPTRQLNAHGYESECPSPKAHQKFRAWYERPSHFKGTLDAFFKIARYEGLTSLWSGLPPTLVMAVPATVVYFTCYDQLKYAMGYQEDNPGTKHIPLLAGSVARVIAATLISPLEMIRTKMQSQQLSYSQVGQAIQVTVRHGGLLSLMRGLGPTLLRDVPFSALYWYGYELAKADQLRKHNTTDLTFTQSFSAGATSGTVAAVVTLPFDVVKTHRQIEMGEAALLTDKKVSTTWQSMLRIVRSEGIPGLFAGIVPRVVKIAPACAIMISTYEYGKHFFRTHNAQKTTDNKWV